jgi:voltage-gated potassium channel
MTWVQKIAGKLAVLLVVYGVLFTASALLFSFIENRSLLDGIWWSGVTASTTGYGDIVPATVNGKILALALMNIVTLFVTPLITAKFSAEAIVDSDVFSHDEQEQIKDDLAEIRRIVNELASKQSGS